jgi:hypothetical protein
VSAAPTPATTASAISAAPAHLPRPMPDRYPAPGSGSPRGVGQSSVVFLRDTVFDGCESRSQTVAATLYKTQRDPGPPPPDPS